MANRMMKIEKMSNNDKNLVFISKTAGGYYFGYKVKVQRGIRGKTKSIVDELLIVGMPTDKAIEHAKKEGIKIEDYITK